MPQKRDADPEVTCLYIISVHLKVIGLRIPLQFMVLLSIILYMYIHITRTSHGECNSIYTSQS